VQVRENRRNEIGYGVAHVVERRDVLLRRKPDDHSIPLHSAVGPQTEILLECFWDVRWERGPTLPKRRIDSLLKKVTVELLATLSSLCRTDAGTFFGS
jgi:hypothetical protein